MRLFVSCAHCGNKIYVSNPSKTRLELPALFFLRCPICGQAIQYTPGDVYAEASDLNIAGGALLGGLVGLLAGGRPFWQLQMLRYFSLLINGC